eukprot:4358107-Pleurochrysis_carterae.AAC.1
MCLFDARKLTAVRANGSVCYRSTISQHLGRHGRDPFRHGSARGHPDDAGRQVAVTAAMCTLAVGWRCLARQIALEMLRCCQAQTLAQESWMRPQS